MMLIWLLIILNYFKYKAALAGKATDHNDGKRFVKDAKIVVPLKYLSNL